jgi:hypothetical protein
LEQLGLVPAGTAVCRDSSYPQRNGNMKQIKPTTTIHYLSLYTLANFQTKNERKSEIKQEKEECQQDVPSKVMSENVGAHTDKGVLLT